LNYRALAFIWLVVAMALMSADATFATVQESNSELGLAVTIVPQPEFDLEPFQAGIPNALALTIEPGSKKIRKIKVASASNRPTLITADIGYAKRINGVLVLDDRLTSPIKTWVQFSQNKFLLGESKVKEIEIEITAPADEPTGVIIEAYLLVTANVSEPENQNASSLVGAARYAIPISIGVGDTTEIITAFSVGVVTLVNSEAGISFSIPITNTGMTPISPIGFLTLSSVLGNLNFGAQIPFGNGVIEAGDLKAIRVLVPVEVPDADWNVHAEIHQGSLYATSDSIITLNREETSLFNSIAFFRIIVSVVFIFLLFYIFLFIKRSQNELKRLRAMEERRSLRSGEIPTL
jgi:hypothetical protein